MDSDTYSKDGKQSDSDEASNGSKFENEKIESSADEEISSKKITEDSSDSKNASGIDEFETEESRHLIQIEKLKNQVKILEEAVLREKAENQNTRKRLQKEITLARDFGVENFVKEFLPIKDSLDMGLANIESASEESFKTGIQLTLKMVEEFLNKMELTQINPKGAIFNPEEHQAMSVENSDSEPPNTVVKVFQVGYKLKDRLIRPAMVVVSTKSEIKE